MMDYSVDATLKETLQRAAELVKDLPERLQPEAFSKVFDELVDEGRARRRGTDSRQRSARTKPQTASGSAKKPESTAGRAKPRRSSSRKGAQAALQQLIVDKFFKTRRTLPQIQEHLRMKRVLQFKQSELSSPLAVLTRKGELEREKNADGVFEYWVEGSGRGG